VKEIKEAIVVALDLKVRNKILAEVKIKINQMKLEEGEALLSSLEQYVTTGIFIFYHAVKIPFKAKDWEKVKTYREKYMDVPDDQIRKRSGINAKIIQMFNIEMETRNEDFKHWNRKLFAVKRAAKLLVHLQTAQSLVGERRFSDAIRNATKVWQLIKENGKEDETKRICRNILSEAYMKEDQFEEAHFFNEGNLAAHANDMKTVIIGMRLALHSRDFDDLRKNGGIAEDILINIVKRNEGNELFFHFRKEFI
jgi:hypothetical protein